jgi:hypothetical protein
LFSGTAEAVLVADLSRSKDMKHIANPLQHQKR